MQCTVPLLQKLEPVRSLPEERLKELITLGECKPFVPGEDPLAKSGGAGRFVYLLAGELLITLPDGSLHVLVGACDAARWPLGYRTAFPVASRAITEGALLVLDFDLVDRLVTWDEVAVVADTQGVFDEGGSWRQMTGAFTTQALTVSAFSRLPPAHIHELLQRFRRRTVSAGQIILHEGESGDCYYLIERGRCMVSKMIGGVSVELAEMRAGEAFGEEALLADTSRNATVTMKTDGVLLVLTKPDFIELLREPLLRPIDWVAAEPMVTAGQARWLDVRYAAEFAEDGLTGALSIPLNEIRNAYALIDADVEYIVYCRSGRRSSAAAFLLAQHGINARWLRGGLAGRVAP